MQVSNDIKYEMNRNVTKILSIKYYLNQEYDQFSFRNDCVPDKINK